MSTTLGFKDIIDLPQWRPNSVAPTATLAGAQLAGDMRNDVSCDPHLYYLNSTANFYSYNPALDGWITRGSPSLAAFVAGSAIAFHPSQGPRGVLAAGNSTTKVVISTVLPASVAINQLANNGSGQRGFRIRIIGNAGGSSGKIEERYIVANTSGTAPTLTLDSALSFTPATGDAYEILSGRAFLYGGATTAGTFKYFDVATNSFSGNLASPGTGSSLLANMIALSELFVPYNLAPSQGFFGNLIATGSAAGTITGQASGGDGVVLTNQYRNFQIRIVQDTVIPTAAGQRRRVTSHTAGASAVYTLASNWTVTPSTTATFVIENDDDKLILMHDASTSVFNYNITANTWDSTTWAASSNARGNGAFMAQSFGIALGTDLAVDGARHSFIFAFRSSVTLDVLDIAGASTGSWANGTAFGGGGPTILQGGSGSYDPVTNSGKYLNINGANGSLQQCARFDVKNRMVEPMPALRYPQGSTVTGIKSAHSFFIDGATKLSFFHLLYNTSTRMFSVACQR
jgi:hypothetical protein